jgi:flagellar FliL protein
MAEKEKAQQEKKAGFAKLPLFGIIALILIMNVLVVGKVFFGGGGKPKTDKEAHGKHEKKEEEVGEKLALDEFLLNLSGGNNHYLRATFAVGLRKGVKEKEMEEEVAPIRDAMLSVLTTKTLEDISTQAGKEKLREEMVKKINEELGEEKVVKIYFVNFAAQ